MLALFRHEPASHHPPFLTSFIIFTLDTLVEIYVKGEKLPHFVFLQDIDCIHFDSSDSCVTSDNERAFRKYRIPLGLVYSRVAYHHKPTESL